jgi:hypothetical protein
MAGAGVGVERSADAGQCSVDVTSGAASLLAGDSCCAVLCSDTGTWSLFRPVAGSTLPPAAANALAMALSENLAPLSGSRAAGSCFYEVSHRWHHIAIGVWLTLSVSAVMHLSFYGIQLGKS